MKHIIQLITERSHEDGPDHVRSYSGRAMYGKECLGIECGSVSAFMVEILENADNMDEVREIADALRNMRSDNMGLGMIVYFPGIPFVESEEDEECDDGT